MSSDNDSDNDDDKDITVTKVNGLSEVVPLPLVNQYDYTKEDSSPVPDGQNNTQDMFVRLAVYLRKYSSVNDDQENGLLVAFFDQDTPGKTIVNTGPLIVNTQNLGHGNRARGFYLESADIVVSLSGVAGALLVGTFPQDTMAGGTISSTTGWNVSGSAGMFGDTPTGSIGFGYSRSNTTSHTYKCIEISNESRDTLHHRYYMAGTTDPHGSSYRSWKDLVWGLHASGFDKITLRGLYPEVSGDDLPIVSQGFWSIPGDFAGTLYVDIDLSFTMQMVACHGSGSLNEQEASNWPPVSQPTVSRSIAVNWP